MAILPGLRDAAQAVAADPEQRRANPWYHAERVASDAVHDGIMAWRKWRDQTAELCFHALFGYPGCDLPADKPRRASGTCASCDAGHAVTGAGGCCESSEHCAVLGGTLA